MPGNDKKRARWRHNPQHEAIVIKALLGDDSVTATELRREHLTINDNYDEQQVNSKLHNLRKLGRDRLEVMLEQLASGQTKKERKAERKAQMKLIGAQELNEQLMKAGVGVEGQKDPISLRKRGRAWNVDEDEYTDTDSEEEDEEETFDVPTPVTPDSRLRKVSRESPNGPLRPREKSPGALLGFSEHELLGGESSSMVVGNVSMGVNFGQAPLFGGTVAGGFGTNSEPLRYMWSDGLGCKHLWIFDVPSLGKLSTSYLDQHPPVMTVEVLCSGSDRLAAMQRLVASTPNNGPAKVDRKFKADITIAQGVKPMVLVPRPQRNKEAGLVLFTFEAEISVAQGSTNASKTMVWDD